MKKVYFFPPKKDSLKTSLKRHCGLFCQRGVKSDVLSKVFSSACGKSNGKYRGLSLWAFNPTISQDWRTLIILILLSFLAKERVLLDTGLSKLLRLSLAVISIGKIYLFLCLYWTVKAYLQVTDYRKVSGNLIWKTSRQQQSGKHFLVKNCTGCGKKRIWVTTVYPSLN